MKIMQDLYKANDMLYKNAWRIVESRRCVILYTRRWDLIVMESDKLAPS